MVTELVKLQCVIMILPSNPVIDGSIFKDRMFRYLNSARTLDVITEESFSYSIAYRIAGYFRGANISRIGPLLEFEGKNFTNPPHCYAPALIT